VRLFTVLCTPMTASSSHAQSPSALLGSLLHEALASMLAPEPHRRVLAMAREGSPRFEDAPLDFVTGPLRDALEAEMGIEHAADLVAEVRAILGPLVQARERESGRRYRTTLPDTPRGMHSAAAPETGQDAWRRARELPTPAAEFRRPAWAPEEMRTPGFEDVSTADLPEHTLELLRARDTQGPPSRPDSPCVVISADPSRRGALARALSSHGKVLQAADEPSLADLLEHPLPAGTVFVIDAMANVSARTFAHSLTRLPRQSTVVVWGSEQTDLSAAEMAALGFVSSSGEATPLELAELLRGLRDD